MGSISLLTGWIGETEYSRNMENFIKNLFAIAVGVLVP